LHELALLSGVLDHLAHAARVGLAGVHLKDATAAGLRVVTQWELHGHAHPGDMLIVIAALDLTIAAEIATAARQDRPAALLLVPYLAWSLYPPR
jgi:hypothetical protein